MIKGNPKRSQRRKIRVRRRILARSLAPRLSVFRSNKYIYAQIIDDQKGATLVAVSEKDWPPRKAGKNGEGPKEEPKLDKMGMARKVGQILAEKASKKGIKRVVFDRGPYQYHGRVKALAEGAREGGLRF